MRLVFVKEVGAYLDADNNVRPIGAKLTISNLRIGGGPTWLNGNNIYPWVEFSNNLYSGVVYCYVQGFDMDVEFFEKGNESKLITFGNEGDNSVFTFASLNGYGNGSLNPTPTKNINRHEFAGLRNNGDGQLVKGSLLKKHSDGKYFADNSTDGHFIDKLASKDFNLAAVSFPLKGTKHEFTMGTTYGRAWKDDATTLVSDANGAFGVYGLKPGKYQLQETQAPAGYVLLKNALNFTVNDETNAFTNLSDMQVDNKPKGVLPSTGGMGIVGLVAAGILAVGAAGVYFKKGRQKFEA